MRMTIALCAAVLAACAFADAALADGGASVLSGVVRDRDGNALVGVELSLMPYWDPVNGPPPPPLSINTRTGADGSFSLTATPGRYSLRVGNPMFGLPDPSAPPPSTPGFYGLSGTVDLSADRRFELTLPTRRVTLTVLDDAGNPLQASVAYSGQTRFEAAPGLDLSGGFGAGTSTDQDGNAPLSVFPTDDLAVTITPVPTTGFPPATVHLSAVSDDRSETVQLQRGVAFSGVVRDRDGNAVPGVELSLTPYWDPTTGAPPPPTFINTRSGPDGSFSFSVSAGRYTFRIANPMFGMPDPASPLPPFYNLSNTLDISGDRRLELTLPNRRVTVTVVDANGAPVEASLNSYSTTHFEAAPGVELSGFYGSYASTDAQGVARLSVFPTDDFALAIQPAPSAGIAPATVRLGAVADDRSEIVRLDRGATLTGFVRDRNGNPIADAQLSLTPSWDPTNGPPPPTLFIGTRSGTDGSYSLSATPGRYSLRVEHPMLGMPDVGAALPSFFSVSGTVDLSSDRQLDLTLPSPLVAVTVDDGGGPIQAVVQASGSTRFEAAPGFEVGGGFVAFARTDEHGVGRLHVFPSDAVTLTVTPDSGTGKPPFTVALGSVTADIAVTVPQQTTPRDSTPPAITPHLNGTQGNDAWYTSDVGVTWDVADGESGVASSNGCDSTTIASDTAGITLTCSATNGRGLSNSRSVTIKRDATAPQIDRAVTPAEPDGQNGWYRTDVSISWSVSDGLSGLASSSGCGPGAVTADTGGTTFTCSAADAAGNHRDAAITIKRDTTAPTIGAAVAPSAPDGANGWYVSSPLVTFACGDDVSGVAACRADGESGATRRIGEAAELQRISGTATDAAGNESHASRTLRVDLTDPVVTCVGTPTFLLHQTGAQVSATVADSASGAVSISLTNAVTTNAVGAFTTSFTGRDQAGRSTTVGCVYTVVYDWAGFFAPVANTGRNAFQAGAAVPFKFSLKGNQGLSVIAAGYPQSQPINCDSGTPLGPPTQATAAGASSLSYDASTDTYTWVWKTEAAWAASCRQFVLKLDDGTSRTAVFTFG